MCVCNAVLFIYKEQNYTNCRNEAKEHHVSKISKTQKYKYYMFSLIYEIYMIKLKVGFFGERNIQAIIWRYTIILWVWSEYRESICYTCVKIICTIKNI